jgi:hypothetical protein
MLISWCVVVMLVLPSLVCGRDVVVAVQRAKCNTFSSVCGMIGSLSILFSHRYWDVKDLRLFRRYVIVLGLLAFVAMQFCANTFDLDQNGRLEGKSWGVLHTGGSLSIDSNGCTSASEAKMRLRIGESWRVVESCRELERIRELEREKKFKSDREGVRERPERDRESSSRKEFKGVTRMKTN